MLFFTEGVINISAIAVLVQDDNQEMALVGYAWSPAGRETNGAGWRVRCSHPWWQQDWWEDGMWSGEACGREEVSGDGNTQSRKQQKAIQQEETVPTEGKELLQKEKPPFVYKPRTVTGR